MLHVPRSARRLAVAVMLCCAPVAPMAVANQDVAARIIVAQATAPAPAPRPGGRAALTPVVVESFAPPPEPAGRATAAPRPTTARAPLPTPRPARAAAATKPAPAPALTAPRPGATTARTVRAAATMPAALKRDELSLLGVFGGPDTRRALLRKPTGTMQRVRQGDRIDAWTVSAIGPESVQLRNGSRTQTLRVP